MTITNFDEKCPIRFGIGKHSVRKLTQHRFKVNFGCDECFVGEDDGTLIATGSIDKHNLYRLNIAENLITAKKSVMHETINGRKFGVAAGFADETKQSMTADKYKNVTNTGIMKVIPIKQSKAKRTRHMRYHLQSNEKAD